jgi:hypothetical protein
MKLQDFVAETLKELIDGVKTAQSHAISNGARVNPHGLHFKENQQHVEFDVAVTTTEGTQTKGGIGVFVGPVGLGSQGQSDNTNSSVSRIRFSIKVVLPGDKN